MTLQSLFNRIKLMENSETVSQYILSASPDEQRETLMDVLYVAKLQGFGGACFPAALAINRILFGQEGELVGYFNRTMLEKHNRFIGHVAVLYKGFYWDSDGHPKEEDEIESWGMLDPQDADYDVGEDDANEIVKKVFTEDELMSFGDPAPFEQAIHNAVKECFED